MRTNSLRPAFETEGPFATVLVDVSHDNENGAHEHDLRVRAACDELRSQGAPDELVERVSVLASEQLDQPSPVARLLVVAPDGVVVDETAGVQITQPTATYAALPDLGRWIAHRDAAVRFVLAVVDHEGGDVAVYDSDVPEPEQETAVGGEERFVHKVPVGGWSALHYQRTTENVWARNAEAVVEEVLGHVRRGDGLVLLAGDPQSRGLVRKALADTQAEVVELESGTRAADGGDDALRQAVREALMGVVVERRLAVLHQLYEGLGRGSAAAAGLEDVADAFVRGQVETLLVDLDAAAELELDPADHEGLALGSVTDPVRADLGLVAAAVLTDADVSVVPPGALREHPVAAILRWDQDPRS
jgi:hypothetical protein